MNSTKYVVITPARDEAHYIEKTIQSMTRQTILPLKWVIVDDGSTDETPRILKEYGSRYPWMHIVQRKNRGYRKAGGGVVAAFNDGYNIVRTLPWEYIVKLDGDLSFAPDYFEKCFIKFVLSPKLGVGGGTVFSRENGRLKVDSLGDPPFHVRGATKIYRRQCWKNIKPLVQAPGWDTIDEVKANMCGWTTRTFPDINLIQHKPTGSADGSWRNWIKNGKANYVTGYHPIFMLIKCIKRATHKPLLIASAGLLIGYCTEYLRRTPRAVSAEAVGYLRSQQLRRITLRPSIYG